MSEIKEWIFLKNRATGKDVLAPVSDVDWRAMQGRGHGLNLFEIIERKAVRTHHTEYVKRILPVVPEEVKPPMEDNVGKPAKAKKGKDRSPKERTNKDAN